MNKQDCILLLNCIRPHFFESENIRNLPKERICDEMILSLDQFEPEKYNKEMDNTVSFGFFDGDPDELREAVGKVDPNWVPFYSRKARAYCGYLNGKVASFCLIENMGIHNINGRNLKIGGPGCVGTVPEYRNKGIGLTMVKKATQVLKEEGYDYSYIHYTGVAAWYAKLGYRTCIQWNRDGVI